MPSQTDPKKVKGRKGSGDATADAANGPTPPDPELDLAIFTSYLSKDGLVKLRNLHLANQDLERKLLDYQAANRVNVDDINQRTVGWERERTELQKQNDHSNEECLRLQGLLIQADEASEAAEQAAADLQRQLQQSQATNAHHLEACRSKDNQITMLEARIGTAHQQATEATEKRKLLSDELRLLKEQQEVLSGEIASAQASLATVRDFMVNLKPLDQQQSLIRDAVAELFTYAFDLCQNAFQHDLNDEILSQRPPRYTSLPTPTSNSSAAKQMRVVIGLLACAKAINKHLFRYTFLTEDSGIEDVLSRLAEKHPLQEAYLRAILLKVLPGNQARTRKRFLRLAVEDISTDVRHWASDKAEFDVGVQQLCDKASACWDLVQQVEERVVPNFTFKYAEDWHQLHFEQASSKKQKGKVKSDMPQVVSTADVAAVVWPAFMVAEPDDPATISAAEQLLVCPGHFVTNTQVQLAAEEVFKAESSHRMARQNSRSGDSVPNRRQNSIGFLYGDSANSKAG